MTEPHRKAEGDSGHGPASSQEALAPVFTSGAFLDLERVRFPLLPLSGDRAEGGRRKDLIIRHKRKVALFHAQWKCQWPRVQRRLL